MDRLFHHGVETYQKAMRLNCCICNTHVFVALCIVWYGELDFKLHDVI